MTNATLTGKLNKGNKTSPKNGKNDQKAEKANVQAEAKNTKPSEAAASASATQTILVGGDANHPNTRIAITVTDLTGEKPVVDTTATNELVDAMTRERRQNVSAGDFLKALKEGSAANPKLTATQLADKLGMGVESFNQRLNSIRMQWKRDRFIGDVKFRGATAESLGMSKEEFDTMLAEVKHDKNDKGKPITSAYDGLTESTAKFFDGPFPWTLADGRSAGNGGGRAGAVQNAILAALSAVE